MPIDLYEIVEYFTKGAAKATGLPGKMDSRGAKIRPDMHQALTLNPKSIKRHIKKSLPPSDFSEHLSSTFELA